MCKFLYAVSFECRSVVSLEDDGNSNCTIAMYIGSAISVLWNICNREGNKVHVLLDDGDESINHTLELIVWFCITLLQDCRAEVFTKLLEVIVLGNEVCLTGKREHNNLLAVGSNEDSSVVCSSILSLCNCCKTHFLKDLLCTSEVSVSLSESLLAIHHTSSGDVPELLYICC